MSEVTLFIGTLQVGGTEAVRFVPRLQIFDKDCVEPSPLAAANTN